MKCRYCINDSDNITGYLYSDGGSAEEDGDFICTVCFDKREEHYDKTHNTKLD